MVFSYSVCATGNGFAKFFARFLNDKLLTLAQIEFITHCRMKDTPAYWHEGPPMVITEITIRTE